MTKFKKGQKVWYAMGRDVIEAVVLGAYRDNGYIIEHERKEFEYRENGTWDYTKPATKKVKSWVSGKSLFEIQ